MGDQYRGQSGEERRADRRQRLLDAALEIFGTQGYAAGTADLICRTARVSPRHFYEHFANRDEVLDALYDQVMLTVSEAIRNALIQAPDTLEGRISAAVDAFLHAYLDDPRRVTVAGLEATPANGRLSERGQRVLGEFSSIIGGEAERLGVVTDPAIAELIVVALVGAANELCFHWLSTPLGQRPDRDELSYTIRQLFFAASSIPPRVPEANAFAEQP